MAHYTETFHTIPVPLGEVGARQLMPVNKQAQGKLPLIILHGGPGSTHDAIAHFLAPLAQDRPVIFYDQLGSARSPAPLTPELMRIERFVAELAAVQDYFDLQKSAILGHSWGGSVVLDFALAHANRTAALIMSAPLIATDKWLEDANRLLDALPEDAREAIRAHENGLPIREKVYEAAEMVFYSRHVCRAQPWPEVMVQSFAKSNRDLYRAMWGRSEFVCTGTLRDYNRWDDLPKLGMPTLICCGEYDEATPETMRQAAKLIPNATLHVMAGCSHVAWAEDTELYTACVSAWLNALDSEY